LSLRKLSALIAFSSSVLFASLYLASFFRLAEYRVYDLFLRLRPRRPQIENVAFLDINDAAIAKIGVYPWPRSVIAEGLLRLKEHGAREAVFDIEFIDKSPTKVDEEYLRKGLALDYNRRFSEIGTTVAQVLNAVSSRRIAPEQAAAYIDDITGIIAAERDALFKDTQRIASDDDLFLSQAAALFGRAWGTLNVQNEDAAPLSGEQLERRSIAEERFSYPVANSGGIAEGKNIDILPAIPLFSNAVRGAGYTNISPDPDGVRRRIFLAQEVHGHWYLQLTFAPLMESWGRPGISAEPRRMTIDRQGEKTNIPLDSDGAMLLDWPPEDYLSYFKHISFVEFSTLEDYQSHIVEYLTELSFTYESLFPAIVKNAGVLLDYFAGAREAKQEALNQCSDEAFARYIALRDRGLGEAAEFASAMLSGNYLENESEKVVDAYSPEIAETVMKEARYCRSLLEYLDTETSAFFTVNNELHEKLHDKTFIIGRVDTGTTDIAVNPFHSDYINVGTHGVVLDTILTKSFITPLPFLWSVIFTLLYVPLVLICISGFKPGPRAVLGIAGIVLAFCLPLGLFIAKRIFFGPLGAILAMACSVIVREIAAFVSSEREKQFIRRAFSTYLSAGVVAEIIADPSKLNLGGEKREMTAIFTDIQGFSGISEQLDPVNLVRLLNKYLTAMSNIIMENQGTIDKYEGDAIVAFFGAPLHMADHAALACRSALMMKRAERELNATLVAEKLSPLPLYTRLGLNTGDMVVGNMGAENKMDYTIMGNAVNLAARLEGVNKQYRTGGILISEFTHAQAGDAFLYRRLDRVRVVGINTPVRLYELTGMADNVDEDERVFYRTWNEAMDLFEQRQFGEAADLFATMVKWRPHDGVPPLYANRCAAFLKKPPAQDWDGVFNLSEK